MDMPADQTRISKRMLPSAPAGCGSLECLYNAMGVCSEPQVNKGNSDALCHAENNRVLLARLVRLPGATHKVAPVTKVAPAKKRRIDGRTDFKCTACGKWIALGVYVMGHWNEQLVHSCGCGQKHSVLRGVVRPLEQAPNT